MVDRFWAGMSTLFTSELVRLLDPETGEAYGNCCASVNPLSNAARAVSNAVVEGDASRLQQAAPNLLRIASDGTHVLAASTRGIPVVRSATHGCHSAMRGAHITSESIPGSLINQILPAASGGPELTGYAYAAEKVARISYTPYVDRPTTFVDNENDCWREISFEGPRPRPETVDHIAAYERGGTAIIGCRGSTDAADWLISNKQILLGSLPPIRVVEAEQFVRKFARYYQFRTIYLVGHSLGGTIAIYVGIRQNMKVHAFNPGANPSDAFAKKLTQLLRRQDLPRDLPILIHRIRHDVASAFSAELDNVTIHTYNQTKRGLAHSLSQFE